MSRGKNERVIETGAMRYAALTRRFAAQLTTSLNAAWAAIALRGGFLSWRVLAPSAGLLAGVIVVRALDRSHRVGIALALRGGVG